MTTISERFQAGPTLSYEFFPPKDAAQAAKLETTIGELAVSGPDFISVTYGALGSTRDTTKDIAILQNTQWDFPTMAHLTCVGQRRTEVEDLVDTYAANGLENILALRGDGSEPGDFAHALDLVALIKNQHPTMSVGVAAHPELHPESSSRAEDRKHLAAKLELADFAITQFFFNADDYHRLVDELDAIGCRKPVIPGIMLFGSAAGLQKMALMNNTSLPVSLSERLEKFETPADVGKLAVDTAVQLVDDLRAYEIPGVHIYTLNKSKPALELIHSLAQDQ